MSDKTKQLSFVADEDTLELIRELKIQLKAPTAAAGFRKALALAKVAADQAADTGIVSVRGKGQKPDQEISVALRA